MKEANESELAELPAGHHWLDSLWLRDAQLGLRRHSLHTRCQEVLRNRQRVRFRISYCHALQGAALLLDNNIENVYPERFILLLK